MHPRSKHRDQYNFEHLCKTSPELSPFLFINKYGTKTLDFSDEKAVIQLNKSLLLTYYNIDYWHIPNGSLCPPIPGRADYIHYLADLLKHTNNNKIPNNKTIKVLDVGTGANCIYPIVGTTQYQWSFVGSDINNASIQSAQNIVNKNNALKNKVVLKKQPNINAIFKNIIDENESYDLTMCNPPFHASKAEVHKASEHKWAKLNKNNKTAKNSHLNFGGSPNELWCKGGELVFIKNMMKESQLFSSQVLWFTCLVSKKENISALKLLLKKLNCSEVKIIKMQQGHKNSRFIAWSFLSAEQTKQWCKQQFSK